METPQSARGGGRTRSGRALRRLVFVASACVAGAACSGYTEVIRDAAGTRAGGTAGSEQVSEDAPVRQGPPNVVFILADDMGWMDCAVCGSEFYETPNLDRLARSGMRFTAAYAANPLCSPTRASILTGQYPGRLGNTDAICHVQPAQTDTYLPTSAPPTSKRIEPVARNRLLLQHFTLAEALKEAGYATALFGKWHLGWDPYEPPSQGFDVAMPGGSYPRQPDYFSPYGIETFADGPPGEHIDERLADEAAAFIEAHRDQPFFLNFWPFSLHSPFQAKPDLIEEYRAKVDPTNPQRSPTMAAMLETMDASVGRLLDTIEALNLADDTIIFFSSDNGGNMYLEVDDTTPTSNHPLRGGKATIYEGGVRVPLIVVWPGVVQPGTLSDALVSSVDFYPTILSMIGAEPASGLPLDGVSFVPVLREQETGVRDAVFCHFPHSKAATENVAGTSVREGDWKLIRFYSDNPNQSNRYELYDLANDLGETTNLATVHPEKVTELDVLISEHLQDTGALVPVPNPDYTPNTQP